MFIREHKIRQVTEISIYSKDARRQRGLQWLFLLNVRPRLIATAATLCVHWSRADRLEYTHLCDRVVSPNWTAKLYDAASTVAHRLERNGLYNSPVYSVNYYCDIPSL